MRFHRLRLRNSKCWGCDGISSDINYENLIRFLNKKPMSDNKYIFGIAQRVYYVCTYYKNIGLVIKGIKINIIILKTNKKINIIILQTTLKLSRWMR